MRASRPTWPPCERGRLRPPLPPPASTSGSAPRAARTAGSRAAWKRFLRLEAECRQAIQRARADRKAADRERKQREAHEAEESKARAAKEELVAETAKALRGSDAAWQKHLASGGADHRDEAVRRLATAKKRLDASLALRRDVDNAALMRDVDAALLARTPDAAKKKKTNNKKKRRRRKRRFAPRTSASSARRTSRRTSSRTARRTSPPPRCPPSRRRYLSDSRADATSAADGRTCELRHRAVVQASRPAPSRASRCPPPPCANHMCRRLILEWQKA